MSFSVIALCNHEGKEGCLSFTKDEELEVTAWNRIGWWWGCKTGAPPGWFSSALVAPKHCPYKLCDGRGGPSVSAALHPSAYAETFARRHDIWPPLPTGPPPSKHPTILVPSWDHEGRMEAIADSSCQQTLGFLADGRVAVGRVSGSRQVDGAVVQLHNYFDYSAWVESQSRHTEELQLKRTRGKPSGKSEQRNAVHLLGNRKLEKGGGQKRSRGHLQL